MKKFLISLMMIGYITVLQAQTCTPFTQTMFYQDFESPTSSTLPEVVNSAPSTITYYNTTGYFIGSRSRAINNNYGDVDYGPVNASFATNVKISFSFAPINIDDNPNDYLQVFIYSGGWSNEVAIWNNSKVNDLTYNLSTTLQNSFTYDGDNNPSNIYISNSNKVNKVEISIPNTVDRSNLKIGFLAKNNRSDEYWIIDDIKITGNFIDTKTWNGTSWTGRTNTAPSNTEIAIIDGNYNTATNGNISACKCTVNNSKSLTIAANSSATIENDLINNGTITVENDGNLIQVNNNGTFTGNNITVKRNSNMKRLGYTYWSSPVASQNLKTFSPNTLNNRFYTYNETNDLFNIIDPIANNFTVAKGYALRAPNDFSNTTASTFNGNFVGVPNNGTKTVAITKTGAGYNLIGNPYPSNISFNSFYAANSSLINQTAYFWTNTNANPTQKGGSYSQNNYAMINGTGYNSAQNSSIKPTNEIVVGQGFIVQAKSAGTLTFNNSMRTPTKGTFFNRMANNSKESVNRYWLELKTPANNFTTILVGYISGATNGIDEDYDSESLIKASDDFYSIQDNKNLAIQGREGNFTVTDKVPLGSVMFEAGNYEISVPQKEGIFNGSQDIYIKDKLLNITAKISDAPYQFSADAGEITNRFEIIYAPETVLGTDEIKQKETLVYDANENLVVENKNQKITEIQIFDVSGRLIKTTKPNDNKVTYTKNAFQKGVLVFKLKTKDKITSKKFLVK